MCLPLIIINCLLLATRCLLPDEIGQLLLPRFMRTAVVEIPSPSEIRENLYLIGAATEYKPISTSAWVGGFGV